MKLIPAQRWLLLLLPLLILPALTFQPRSKQPRRELPRDAYIWQRQWTPAITAALEQNSDVMRAWRVLVAELGRGGRRWGRRLCTNGRGGGGGPRSFFIPG